MFENIIRKATNTAGRVIKQEVAKGANTHISLGIKIVAMMLMVAIVIHDDKKDKDERQNPIPGMVTYNFYGTDGEKLLEMGRF